MDDPLRAALDAHASLSIVGMGKNAGKTTVLGRLLALLEGDPRTVALTSCGRDGEGVDVVTGTAKPGIWLRAGMLFATAADLLRLGDVTPEILEATGMRTPLGEVVIARALSDGAAQLAGPSTAAQLAALVGILRGLGAELVLIDGAVSRRSLAMPAVSGAAILCAGASYSPDMDAVVADTAHICRLMSLPVAREGAPGHRPIDGALTDVSAEALRPAPGDVLVVRDSSRILLSRMAYDRLAARGVGFAVRRATTLCCVCVNPYSARGVAFDPTLFRQKMAEAVDVPVINVKEMP